ncbi:hypothetical protein [Leekyejoonella antrihumi]|uniref:Uncharacterized protein n=1 Tax=Leekyejoonella antrihumi TaxID=1660198 RepID=A0A563E7A8_9MICO|nr:hypothetical protein [Leekyejoonella antrihumi]TWP38189.1 hypothetical protein FGL98_02875 [Leekyejoonella antrihumi]
MRRLPAQPDPSHSTRAHDVARDHRLIIGGVLATLVVLVVGGYTMDWSWTGFGGNTVWDWLNLLILPVVLTALPLWQRTRRSHHLHWRIAWILAMVTLVVLAVGGYTLGWSWTGFHGNTVWDWLKLLIVPFVLPLVLSDFTRAAHPANATTAAHPLRKTD